MHIVNEPTWFAKAHKFVKYALTKEMKAMVRTPRVAVRREWRSGTVLTCMLFIQSCKSTERNGHLFTNRSESLIYRKPTAETYRQTTPFPVTYASTSWNTTRQNWLVSTVAEAVRERDEPRSFCSFICSKFFIQNRSQDVRNPKREIIVVLGEGDEFEKNVETRYLMMIHECNYTRVTNGGNYMNCVPTYLYYRIFFWIKVT